MVALQDISSSNISALHQGTDNLEPLDPVDAFQKIAECLKEEEDAQGTAHRIHRGLEKKRLGLNLISFLYCGFIGVPGF